MKSIKIIKLSVLSNNLINTVGNKDYNFLLGYILFHTYQYYFIVLLIISIFLKLEDVVNKTHILKHFGGSSN